MGDDTWDSLFPSKFNKSFPYPSFNVKDLHTVDNGVISNLIPEITGKDPWNIIIGHFLGVDHVGHRYDSDHPIMASKLGQMNRVIEDVIAVISEDTLLIIMGDHGSTRDGNHGGATPEEVNAGLFFYSKKPINLHPILPRPKRIVSQIDLVPTLSLLLGIPIPFGNLGIGIPELLFFQDFPSQFFPSFSKMNAENLDIQILQSFFPAIHNPNLYQTISKGVYSIYLNCWQMFRYVETYSKISDEFPHLTMKSLQKTFLKVNEKYQTLKKSPINSEEALKNMFQIFLQYKALQNEISEMCREAWIVFDEIYMIIGAVILGISCFILLTQFLEPFFNFNRKAFCLNSIIFMILAFVLSYISQLEATLPALCLGYSLGSALIFLTNLQFSLTLKIPDRIVIIPYLFTIFAIIVQELGLASNSYIEAQDKGVRFLILSLGMILLLMAFQTSNCAYKNPFFWIEWVLFMLTIKMSEYSTGGIYESAHTPLSIFLMESILPLFFIFFLLHFVKKYALIDSNFILFEYLMIFQIFLVGLFWILQRTTFLETFSFGTIILPWVVYLTCLYLFFKQFNLYSPKELHTNPTKRALSFSLMLAIIPYPSLLLILGIKSPIALFLLYFQSFLFLHLLLMLTEKKSLPWASVWWGFFTIQFFYTTGHTFDFNSLHWASAFVGFEEINWIGGGILMMIETFVAQILFSFSLPILVYWFTYYSTKPTPNLDSISLSLFSLSVLYLLFFALNSTFTTFFVYAQRRHLMVWRIFAPKYVFEGLILLVVDFVVILTTFLSYYPNYSFFSKMLD